MSEKTIPVYVPNDDGELVIDADKAAEAGVKSIEFIEGAPTALPEEAKSHSVMQCYKADAHIAELEVELRLARETIANLRDYNERAPKIAAEVESTQIAELKARLKEAEGKFKDEREHAEWLQGECNKAVDDMEEANSRAEKAEADNVKLRQALEAVELQAENERLRAALVKVEAYLADVGGALYRLWDDGEILEEGKYEEWEQALAELRNFSRLTLEIGLGVEWESLTLYREVLQALRPAATAELPAEKEDCPGCGRPSLSELPGVFKEGEGPCKHCGWTDERRYALLGEVSTVTLVEYLIAEHQEKEGKE